MVKPIPHATNSPPGSNGMFCGQCGRDSPRIRSWEVSDGIVLRTDCDVCGGAQVMDNGFGNNDDTIGPQRMTKMIIKEGDIE